MRVLVCGGRNFGEMPKGLLFGAPDYFRAQAQMLAERRLLNETLNALPVRPSVIIHGAARGADRLADNWAQCVGIRPWPFKANWFPNGREAGLDRSAGPRRNQQMIDEARPELVVAFPGGDGTADMVQKAKAADVKVIEVTAPQPLTTGNRQDG